MKTFAPVTQWSVFGGGKPSLSAFARLQNLVQVDDGRSQQALDAPAEWQSSGSALSALKGRLGSAGFATRREQRIAHVLCATNVLLFLTLGALVGSQGSRVALVAGVIVGLYLGALTTLLVLKRLRIRQEQQTLYFTPLILEELILLVESGLGLLPALQRIVEANTGVMRRNPVVRVMRLVYDFAANGLPFGQALSMVAEALPQNVLRHVLLHLDVSARQGAELIPALRALSNHSHTEWKLSVETRVKRLENLVVFPVFTAVIGLMFLTAAAPLVPVLELRESLQERSLRAQDTTSAIAAPLSRRSDGK